jgi:hypothetical protein
LRKGAAIPASSIVVSRIVLKKSRLRLKRGLHQMTKFPIAIAIGQASLESVFFIEETIPKPG